MNHVFVWIVVGFLGLLAGLMAAVYLISGGPVSYVDEAAHAQLRAALGQATLTVYPARVRGHAEAPPDFDAEAGRAIAAFVNERGWFQATFSAVEPGPLDAVYHVNQQRVAMATAESFAAFVATRGVDSDYALLAEYFVGERAAGAVHYYIATRDGRVADAATLNSHHPIFQRVQPRTVADCTEVALRHLAQEAAEWAGDGR